MYKTISDFTTCAQTEIYVSVYAIEILNQNASKFPFVHHGLWATHCPDREKLIPLIGSKSSCMQPISDLDNSMYGTAQDKNINNSV